MRWKKGEEGEVTRISGRENRLGVEVDEGRELDRESE